jgi:chloramphenicol 3-O phosphotransferase
MNQPTRHDSILLFNGASSAGKTSLCKQVQSVLDWPSIHLEEDRFVYDTVHPRFLQPGVGEQTFERTMLGYYRSLAAFASTGFCVLADTGFYSQLLVDVCRHELRDRKVWWIGVHCSLAELERREQSRPDRAIGLARSQYDTIHAHARYDIEVDTSAQTLEACALQIKSALTARID